METSERVEKTNEGTVDKKLSNFLADFVVLMGEGVKTNLLKVANFQTKVCCFKLYSPHHSYYKTRIWIHISCLSACWIFRLCRLLRWGECALTYSAATENANSACWKPALSIREQNSSHLQDFCNAFPTKGRVKYLSNRAREFWSQLLLLFRPFPCNSLWILKLKLKNVSFF